jgi:hypothetical protein
VGTLNSALGTLRASIDSGGISTSNVQASGIVSSATLVGTLVSAGSVGAAGITTGTLYANTITVGNLYVSGYTISMNVTAVNLIQTNITAGTIVAGTITAGNITSANIGATFISAASMLVAPNIVSSTGLTAGTIVAGTITAGNVRSTSVSTGSIKINNTGYGIDFGLNYSSKSISLLNNIALNIYAGIGLNDFGVVYQTPPNSRHEFFHSSMSEGSDGMSVAIIDSGGISTSNLRCSGITSASILSTDITSTNILTTNISAGTMSFGANAFSIVLNGNDKVINFTGGSVGYIMGKNMGGGAMNTTLPNHFGIQMRSTAGANGGIYLGSTGTVHLSAGFGATTGSLICTNSIVDNITSVNIVNSNITTAALRVSGRIDFGYYYSSKSIGLFNDGGSNYAGIGFNNSGSLAYQVPLSTKHEFFYASTPSSDGISVAIIDNTGISTSNLKLSGGVTCGTIKLSNVYGIDFATNYGNQQIGLAAVAGADFFGIGANNSAMQYQAGSSSSHKFYTNSTMGTSNAALGTLLATIDSSGISTSNLQISGAITTNNLVANSGITIMGDNKIISFTAGTVGYNVGTNLQGGAMHTVLPGHFAIQGRTPGAAGLYLGSTGTLHIASGGVTNGSLICTNITTANIRTTALTVGSTSYTSDARLKTDIMPLSDALSTIAQLKPSSYRMKFNLDDEFVDDKINYGLIAQDVYKVVPQLVSGNTSGSNTLGLDYNSLFVLTMKALQELTEEHNKLKEDFENFKNRM